MFNLTIQKWAIQLGVSPSDAADIDRLYSRLAEIERRKEARIERLEEFLVTVKPSMAMRRVLQVRLMNLRNTMDMINAYLR